MWYEYAGRIIKLFAGMVIFVFIIASSLLLPVYLPLYLELRELKKRLLIEEDASKKLRVKETLSQVGAIKATLTSISNFAADSNRASLILEEFLASQKGITLFNLQTGKNGQIRVSGKAEARHDLLEFEKKLRESGRFQEISFPFSNIIRETDINFTLEGKLKTSFMLNS